jgi:Cys-tRNA(Pro)/Cys-tRNA(Cys) deacylase
MMNYSPSSDAPPVSRALAELNVRHRVFRHNGPVRSLEQAAAERDQHPEQVIRSIVFRLAENEYLMVLMAGPAQISWPALRAYLGRSRLTTASAEELLAVTGYEIGAVAPFGLSRPMRVLVDRSVIQGGEISMGSGVRGTAVILAAADLLRALPNAEIGDFAEPPAG